MFNRCKLIVNFLRTSLHFTATYDNTVITKTKLFNIYCCNAFYTAVSECTIIYNVSFARKIVCVMAYCEIQMKDQKKTTYTRNNSILTRKTKSRF